MVEEPENGVTTVRVAKTTLARIHNAESYPREFADSVINRALDALQEKNAPKVPAGVSA